MNPTLAAVALAGGILIRATPLSYAADFEKQPSTSLHWAFQLPFCPPVPVPADNAWGRNASGNSTNAN